MDRLGEKLREALEDVKVSEQLRARALRRALAPQRTATVRSAGWLRLGATALASSLATITVFLGVVHGLPGRSTPPVPSPEPAAAAVAFVPQYVPERFDLSHIVAEPNDGASLPTVTIRYSSPDGGLDLSQTTLRELETSPEYQPIAIDGQEGWIRLEEDGTLVLVWSDERNQYRMRGSLTEGEALRIAGSIEVQEKEAALEHEKK
jgi:hypothetical protein